MELMPMSDADTEHSVKPEVHRIIVQVAAPRGNFPGQTTEGYYTVVDSVLTMTDTSGIPIRTPGGDYCTHRLGPDENPRRMANVLTKEIRRSIRGGKGNFNDPLPSMESIWGKVV
jgi:hypothetical protein